MYKYLDAERIQPLGGDFIAEKIIERSKDVDIIYLTTDVILDTNGVKQLAKYLSELETYKKIAEKLADTLYEVFCLRPMTVSKVLRKQGFDDNKCEECEDSCYQCLLDWARKEVEKC